ncbi:MAG: hypothetical protein ACREQL_04330 [Candidatus Binatia bacterium]
MGALLHALAGFAVAAALALCLPGWLDWRLSLAAVVVLSGYGVWRELSQHRDDRPRLTLHRWIEGLAWGAGAALGGLL